MVELPPITLRLRGRKVVGRVAFSLLLFGAIALGALAGLLFVDSSDLPQIRALEDFQPDVVTELYADDGHVVGNFALQRRVLLTYEQYPQVLKDAILTTEDQHFEEHWGVDFTRVAGAAWKDILAHRVVEGASTITMQLAGTLFLDRSDRRMGRKIQEALLALQIERHYSKQQIFTMYSNQIYLSHGNYGFEAASEYYFGKPVGKLNVQEAALLAGLIRGPSYSPILHPQRALARVFAGIPEVGPRLRRIAELVGIDQCLRPRENPHPTLRQRSGNEIRGGRNPRRIELFEQALSATLLERARLDLHHIPHRRAGVHHLREFGDLAVIGQ